MTLTRNDITFSNEVTYPKAQGYNIRIGDLWFRTIASKEVKPQIGTRDSLAQRTDDAGSVYQNVLDLGYAWARTDLSGGEGLDWSPREFNKNQNEVALDAVRYWDSVGLDLSRPDTAGERYSMRLTRDFDSWGGTVTDPRDMAASQDKLYVADDDTVSWYSSWTNTTAISFETLTSPVVALAASPNDVVVAVLENGNAYGKRSADATFTLIYGDAGATETEATGVWYVRGRFIIGCFDGVDESSLITVPWSGTAWGTAVTVDTSSAPFWSVVESGPAIVAACGDGTVRTYTPDNGSGGTYELDPRGRTDVPVGETPILLGANAGIVLILTSSENEVTNQRELRVYQAEVLDSRFDYVVAQLQLRREWQTSVDAADVVRNMANTRDEIFFYIKEYFDGSYQQCLWRFDVVTAGLSRVNATASVDYRAITVFDDVIGTIDFDGLSIEIQNAASYVDVGWMIFPNITFGLNTDISWMATIMEVANLVTGGSQVELWRTTEESAINDWQDPSWSVVQRFSSPGLSGTEVTLPNVKSRTLALQVRVYPHTSGTGTPQITRTAIRGIPTHRDVVMVIPVNVSDIVSAPGRKPVTVPGLGDYLHNQMMDLVGTSVEVILLNPSMNFRGIVNNVSEPIIYQPNRGSMTTYCQVEFRGKRIVDTAPTTGDAGMGLGLLGISTMGIGQTE